MECPTRTKGRDAHAPCATASATTSSARAAGPYSCSGPGVFVAAEVHGEEGGGGGGLGGDARHHAVPRPAEALEAVDENHQGRGGRAGRATGLEHVAHGTRAARDAGQRRGGRDRDRGRHARARVKPDRLVVQGAPVPGDISCIAARGCRVCEFVVVEARRCSRKRSNARARSGDGRPRGAPRGGARGPEPARGRFGAPRAGGRALASGVCERARAGVLRSDVLGRMRVGRGGSVSRRAGRRRRGRGVDARVRGGHDARRRRADRDDAPVLRAARRHGTTPGRPPESRPGRVRASGRHLESPARCR